MKLLEEIYPFGSQYPKVTNVAHPKVTNPAALSKSLADRSRHRELTSKEKALQKSAQIQTKLFAGRAPMKQTYAENKVEDRIYTMAFIKECRNLSKEDKLTLLEFVYKEPDMKRVLKVVEKYVELDEGIWTRVVEATKQAKGLFYTQPAGKKDLKFAGKKPKASNKQLSKVMARE
jgi:hypothetical protein